MPKQPYKCEECGSEHDDARFQKYCQKCNFWMLCIQQVGSPQVAIFCNKYFVIGDENVPLVEKGYSGRQIKFFFKDGRVVTTTNLWDGGPIPERFHTRLTNNVVRVEGLNVREESRNL